MSCHHAICDRCLRLSSKNITHETGLADSWQVDECPICGSRSSFVARTKPDTAGIRILTIDGGGIKGIIPLENLALLQQLAGPDCPIQELIDLAYGTSAGKSSLL